MDIINREQPEFLFFSYHDIFFTPCLQDVKKAIISDLTKLGKEAGLKSFEQVMRPHAFPLSTSYIQINFYWPNLPLEILQSFLN